MTERRDPASDTGGEPATTRERLRRIIFGIDTPAGRRFDLILIIAILISVTAVLLDSIAAVRAVVGPGLKGLEWAFTVVFTVEYLLRVWCVDDRRRYVTSFYGLVDLLSILPTYLGLLLPDTRHLIIIRLLRVLRIFRVLKLLRYVQEANALARSLYAARRKIAVFLFVLLILATVFGALMFVIEGPANGFTSIPRSIYWAIISITTVGYGDITPQTAVGQAIAALTVVTGYSIIAVPTGIISAELFSEMQRSRDSRQCGSCGRGGHDSDAAYCKHCGALMPGDQTT